MDFAQLNAILQPRRVPPPGLHALPFTLRRVVGWGRVDISPGDAITAAIRYNPTICNAGVYYVKPSTGNDTTGDGSAGSPWATFGKAFRTASGAASRVCALEDCTVTPFDLRNTDASQTAQQFKWLDANGYAVTIKDTGPALASQTWTRDGTNTKCFTSTLSVTGSAQPTRVLRTDQTDSRGVYKGLRKYTSAALLNAGTGDGWYWDNTGKVMWLKIGDGTDVQAQRSILAGLYLGSAGTCRMLSIGAAAGFSGVRFEGVQFVQIDGGGRRPEFWLHNCTVLWSTGKGADLTQAGIFAMTNCWFHSSQSDGINAFAKSATVSKGLLMLVNSLVTRAGDQDVFPADGTLQGVSAHGGSHHVSWGMTYTENNGQGVADTCANSEAGDISWLVAVDVYGFVGGTSVSNYQIGSAATSASRTGYFDTCRSFDATSGTDVTITTNGTGKAYRPPFGVMSGALAPYCIGGPG